MDHQDSIEKITKLIGTNVKVNLGGPESMLGELLTVRTDYLAINTEQDGVVYYQLRHVRGVAVNTEATPRTSERSAYYDDPQFIEVVRRLKHKKVKINRGGPESVQGVVSNIFDNHLELTTNNEVVFLSIFHIKSISQVSSNRGSGNQNRSGSRSRNSNRSRNGNGRSRSRRSASSGNDDNQSSRGRRSNQSRSSRGRDSGRNRSRASRNVKGASMNYVKVSDAYHQAQNSGNTDYMFNDPDEKRGSRRSGNRSARTTQRRQTSNRSRGSHQSNRTSHRSTRSSRRSNRSGGRSRSDRRSNRSGKRNNRSGDRSNRSDNRSNRRRSRNHSSRRGGWIKVS